MSLKVCALMSIAFLTSLTFAQEAPLGWDAELSAGKSAFTSGKYALAVEKYREALNKADAAEVSPASILPILRSLATALRTNADPVGAQKVLERALAIMIDAKGVNNVETAPVLSELAVVQRAQELRMAAVASLRQSILVRRNARVSEELARDFTLMGTLYHEMGEEALAIQNYTLAISFWGALPDSGLQILTALDPLADIRRNLNEYQQAEELYMWVLRLREAALGPKDAELISTLDSLAYVLFGQKKYAEAEVMYNRLLAMWEMVGGPDHPMLSLTLDKMTEFYIEQKKYDLAEPIAQRALAIRSKETVETLHRTGRILTGRKKLDDAIDLYGRTLRIAADTRVPDEEIPGTLRAYALLLRQKQRTREADALEKRGKEAAARQAEKEGKRTAPSPPPTVVPTRP